MDSQAHKFQISTPYEVQFNPGCGEPICFERFSDALAYWRGYLKGQRSAARDDGPRIVNTDRLDGAEDGCPSGLTEDEREALSNAE